MDEWYEDADRLSTTDLTPTEIQEVRMDLEDRRARRRRRKQIARALTTLSTAAGTIIGIATFFREQLSLLLTRFWGP